jgi:hypothetical protein
MKNSESIYFSKDQFKQTLKAARVALKGRRGLSSKKKRIKVKIFRQFITMIINSVCIEEVGNDILIVTKKR